jgi:hypothetical protein
MSINKKLICSSSISLAILLMFFPLLRITASADDGIYAVDLNDSSSVGMLLEGEMQSLRPIDFGAGQNYFDITNISVSADSLRSSIEMITPPDELSSVLMAYNQLSSIQDISEYISNQSDSVRERTAPAVGSVGKILSTAHYRPGGSVHNAADTFSQWDPVAVVGLAQNDVLDLQRPRRLWVDGRIVETADMRPQYVGSVRGALFQYSYANLLQDDGSINETIQGAIHYVRAYNSLEESLMTKIGKIYFGLPLIIQNRNVV